MSLRKNMPAPDLAAHLANRPSGILAVGSNPLAALEEMAAERSEIFSAVKEVTANIKSFRFDIDQQVGELASRLQNVEQVVAYEATMHGAQTGGGGPSVGNDVLRVLGEDPAFASAAQAAGRNQRASPLSIRVDLPQSIKAALTNEPWEGGSSDGSYMPSQPGRGGLVGPALRSLRLLDVLPSRPVTTDSVEFVQMAFTGDASEQEYEGDAKPEISADGTLATANIVTVAGWLAASRQVLSDHQALASLVDQVLRHKVRSRLEHQLINGPGGQGRINGLLNQATPLVPTIGVTAADIIGEALVTMADAGYSPGLVLMNPFDWLRILTTRTTTEEAYVFGSPTMPVPPSLWNTSIVLSPSVPEDTALTIDTSFTTVLDREQANVLISNSHSDFFTRNLIAILAELRAGLEVLDQGAVYSFDLGAVSSGA